MSQKMRGSEATIRIAVDGVVQPGSMFKVVDFTATPRTDLHEDDYLGETETDLDIQHHGWDLGFSVDVQDAQVIELCDEIIQREIDHDVHPDITITVLYTFREPGARGKIAVYHGVFLKNDEESFGGRKEKVKGKFSGKCKRRTVLNA
jgi:hypothetical protein